MLDYLYWTALLQVDPRNRQAQVRPLNKIVHLMTGIGVDSHPMAKDGMAVAGGAAIALGGLVGLGLALAGRQRI